MVGAIAIIIVALVLIVMSSKRAKKSMPITRDGKLEGYRWPGEAYVGGIKNFSDLKRLETAINDSPYMWSRIDFDENLVYVMFREQDPEKEEALLRKTVEGEGFTLDKFLDMAALEERLDLQMKDAQGRDIALSPTQLAKLEAEAKKKREGSPFDL